jgi:hypothetical protein
MTRAQSARAETAEEPLFFFAQKQVDAHDALLLPKHLDALLQLDALHPLLLSSTLATR